MRLTAPSLAMVLVVIMIIDHSHGFSLDESQSYSKEIKQKGKPKQIPTGNHFPWEDQNTYLRPGDINKNIWINDPPRELVNNDGAPRPPNTPPRASANLPFLPSNGAARQLVVNDGEPRPPGK